ncbi:MAG: nicotinate-nucleotide diphosphorylase (carboxylating), partial [Candidatus Omnitrophica bacterium]|nr:nicotinate-nucleotide diphosphorylase (carboxylating) [Candidatus Omnitrophota bacterium]
EVDTLEEFEKALKQRPDIIMLDNLDAETVKKAAQVREAYGLAQEILLEVSGGITLDNVEGYAATGVDTISVGALTDSVRGIDFSLTFVR